MLNFSSGGLDFGSGSDANKRTQYLLIGGLALIVAGSLAFTYWYLFVPRTVTVELPKEYHMFCVNCNKEVIIPSEKGLAYPGGAKPLVVPGPSGDASAGPPGAPPAAATALPSAPPGQMKAICPICGKPALIVEKVCPKCKQFYVTDWEKTHSSVDTDPQADTFNCPHCGVNIEEYRKSHE